MPTPVRRGRPRKYASPSRAVTLTLPEEVIDALTASDPDLSRAIVRLAPTKSKQSSRPAELCHFGTHAVIVAHADGVLHARRSASASSSRRSRSLCALSPPAAHARDRAFLRATA